MYLDLTDSATELTLDVNVSQKIKFKNLSKLAKNYQAHHTWKFLTKRFTFEISKLNFLEQKKKKAFLILHVKLSTSLLVRYQLCDTLYIHFLT